MLIKWFMAFSITVSFVYANSYTLDILCQKGVENNPRIKSFQHQTAASHKVYDQNFDRYKPSLNLSGQAGYQKYTYGEDIDSVQYEGNTYNYRATVNQVLYKAALGYAMDDAEKRIVLAGLQEEDEKAKLIAQILQSSFELVKLKKIMLLYQKKEEVLLKAYNNIEKSNALQLASKVDVLQSLSRLQQSRSDMAGIKQLYQNKLFNLKLLTKQTKVEKYLNSIRFNIDSIKKTYRSLNLAAVKSQYRQSTRLKFDKQIASISKGEIDLRASERYPSFNLALNAGDTGGSMDNITRRNESSAMVSVDFPIYQGGYVSDRKEEARLLYLSALSEVENTEMTVKISLEKALQDIASGLETAKADSVAVEAAKNYFEVTIKSYDNGLGSLTDAYLAEAEYYDSKVRLISTKAAIFMALAEVYYSSGTADVPHVKRMYKKHLK